VKFYHTELYKFKALLYLSVVWFVDWHICCQYVPKNAIFIVTGYYCCC